MKQVDGASSSPWVWPVLCIILSILLFYLVYQNMQLRRELGERSEYIAPANHFNEAPIGEGAVPIDGYMSDGRVITLVADTLSHPLILAWFSDECDACYFAREGWNRLMAEYPSQTWAIRKSYGPEPDSLFFGEAVDFPIVSPVDAAVFDEYHTHGTPQTMIIDSDRTISRVWKGALGPDKIDEIISAMNNRNERR